MKKLFKRIALLLCLVTLFSAPSTAFASTNSTPVLDAYYPEANFRSFVYRPSPLTLNPGTGTFLHDLTSSLGTWFVPAGEIFSFYCNFGPVGNYHIEVFRADNGGLVHMDTFIDSIVFFSLPAIYENAAYYITIRNVGSWVAYIDNYGGYSQQ